MALTLQPTSPYSSTTSPTTLSVGVQALSPTNNISAPSNTLPTNQVATNYSNYINKNGTIYNTKGATANTTAEGGYATPDALAKDLGISTSAIDFSKITSNPNYTSTFGTAPAPAPTPTPTPNPAPSSSNNPPPTTPPATASSSGSYVPPNGGINGVSQGGIIGNLNNNALNNPGLTTANKNLEDLQNNYAQATNDIESRPEGLSQQSGQEGLLNRLFASKLSAAQTAVQNALQGQSNTTSGLSAAANANAPIVAQLGTAILSPSANTTTNTTSSGTTNLSSLIGQRPSPSDPTQTEYYNMQTKQGFSSPQQLADFVNQEMPNANATAQNVFDLLKSGALNGSGSNIVGLNSGAMNTYVQMVLSGQANQIPASITGNLALWQQVLQQAQQQNPNLNLNQINAQVGANTSIYGSNLDKATTLNNNLQNIKNLGNLTVSNGIDNNINPFSSQFANYTISQMRKQFSSQGQLTFDSNINQLKSAINSLYSSGGTPSQQSQISDALANPNISMAGLQALVNAAESEGQTMLTTAQGTASSAYSNINVGGNTQQVTNWGWSG